MSAAALHLIDRETYRKARVEERALANQRQRLKHLTADELAVFVVIRDVPISPVQVGRLLGWTWTDASGNERACRKRVVAATCELARYGLIRLRSMPGRTKTRYVRRCNP